MVCFSKVCQEGLKGPSRHIKTRKRAKMQGNTSQVTKQPQKQFQILPKSYDNVSTSEAKSKALLLLRAYQEEYGLSNGDIAKALNYNKNYISMKAKKLSAVDFVKSSDIKKAFKSLKLFSIGKPVNNIKPKDKTILSAAMDIIKIGTDHKDNQENSRSLTLNLNVLRGLEPDTIAIESLDDRTMIDVDDTITVKEMCLDKCESLDDLRIEPGSEVDDFGTLINDSEIDKEIPKYDW